MLAVLRLLFLQASYVGAGLLLLRAFPCNLSDFSRSTQVAIWYLGGCFLQVVTIHVPLIIGYSSVMWATVVPIACIGGLYLIPWTAGRGTPHGRARPESARASWLKLGLLLPGIAYIAVRFMTLPDVEYDSTAFWYLKAKLLASGDHFGSDSFRNPLRVHLHQNYPLFFPILALQNFIYSGSFEDWAYRSGVLMYNLMGLVMCFGVVSRRVGFWYSIITIGILLYSPVFCYRNVQGSLPSAYVDFPLAVMISASVAFAVRAVDAGGAVQDITWASLFSAAAILIKTEGIIFAPLLIIATAGALYLRGGRMTRWANFATAWMPSLIVLVGWLLVRASLPDDSGFGKVAALSVSETFQRAFSLLVSALRIVSSFWLWGGLIPLSAFLVVLQFFRRPFPSTELVMILMLLIYLAGITAMFLFMDLDPSGNTAQGLMNVTFHRILIHVLPAVVIIGVVGQPALQLKRI